MHFVQAKGILSAHHGINVYRGCTHGCIYCDSRSSCYQMNHDFEDIEAKENAPELLQDALLRRKKAEVIATGAMCDPYMPCEKTLRLTQQCLTIIEQLGFGAAVQTKSDLVLRDLPLFSAIHDRTKAVLQMTLTTYDEALCRIVEPNVCTTYRRYEVLKKFQEEHIPTIVWLAPVLPFLCDTEENLHGILSYCLDAGVKGILCFDMGVTLRTGNREYFYAALDRHFPGLKMRYHQTYRYAYMCQSPNSNRLLHRFHETCAKYGVLHTPEQIFSYLRTIPQDRTQLSLF